MSALPPTPFSVIGGFLGAGKTTLLNHLLSRAGEAAEGDDARASRGTRYAVLVNDFGAIDIDARLVAAHDGETLSLSNGCVCCSLASGFIETMLRVTAMRHRFDHVLVEASGVSRPERIMDIARLDPELEPGATLVLVDALELRRRLADAATGDLVAAQLRVADLLIVNKVDLASEAALGDVLRIVREHNPRAGIVRASRADVPPSVLFGPSVREPVARADPGALAARVTLGTTPGAVPDDFHTASLTGARPVSRDELARFETSLDASVIRGKGVLRLTDEPGWWTWQRVGAASRVEPLSPAKGEPARVFSLALIATAPVEPARLDLPASVRALKPGEGG